MPRATRSEIITLFEGNRPGLVLEVSSFPLSHPSSCQSGYHYFLPDNWQIPTNQQILARSLATQAASCHYAEIALIKINDVYCITVGPQNFATITILVPPQDTPVFVGAGEIEEFRLIAHTHSYEQNLRSGEMMPQGPSPADYEMINLLFQRWGQRESLVIYCRGGIPREIVPFSARPGQQRPSLPGATPLEDEHTQITIPRRTRAAFRQRAPGGDPSPSIRRTPWDDISRKRKSCRVSFYDPPI